MKLKYFSCSYLQENIYIYYDENTGDAVIIDPGGDSDKIIKFINQNNLNLKSILLTHGHFDHIAGVDSLKEKFECNIIAYKDEIDILSNPNFNLTKTVLGEELTISPDVLLEDGEIFLCGSIKLKAIHTPGHTPGSCCFYDEAEKIIFTGDTLFLHSIGRADFPLGNPMKLTEGIKNKLFCLNDDIKVFSGHGSSTTIGEEKKNNPYVRLD